MEVGKREDALAETIDFPISIKRIKEVTSYLDTKVVHKQWEVMFEDAKHTRRFTDIHWGVLRMVVRLYHNTNGLMSAGKMHEIIKNLYMQTSQNKKGANIGSINVGDIVTLKGAGNSRYKVLEKRRMTSSKLNAFMVESLDKGDDPIGTKSEYSENQLQKHTYANGSTIKGLFSKAKELTKRGVGATKKAIHDKKKGIALDVLYETKENLAEGKDERKATEKAFKVVDERFDKGGVLNGNYLDNISADKKNKILKNIANHYGISLSEAEVEVRDADAIMLYEYITNKELRMDVHNDIEGGKFAKGGQLYDVFAINDKKFEYELMNSNFGGLTKKHAENLVNSINKGDGRNFTKGYSEAFMEKKGVRSFHKGLFSKKFANGGGVDKERLDAILERRTEINNYLNKKYGRSRGKNKSEKDEIDSLAKEYRKLGDEYLELNGGYNEYAKGSTISGGSGYSIGGL